MFRVNNKDTDVVLVSLLSLNIIVAIISSIPGVEFEQMNICWVTVIECVSLKKFSKLNPLSANPAKWSNTLRHFVRVFANFCGVGA